MPLGVVRVILPGCHRLWRAVPGRFGLASYSHVAVPQPQRCKHPWFGLVPVRSPLLGGSRLLSLPPGTEMFQFPGFASLLREMTDLAARRVAAFGDPGITACLQLPQAYRSLPRPSSPPCAKASTVRPYALDLIALGVIPQHHTHHTSVVKERGSGLGAGGSGKPNPEPRTPSPQSLMVERWRAGDIRALSIPPT